MKILKYIILYCYYISVVVGYNYIFNIGSTGLLLPYSLGIVGYIKKNINVKKYELFGTSGGAYCSLLYKYEEDFSNHDFIWKNIFELDENTKIDLYNLHDFQINITNNLLKRYKKNNIDNNKNKKIYIIATKYNNFISKENIIFDNFDNIEDLIYKCYCSSYIPYISGNTLYYKYNNNKYYDGAFNSDYSKKYNYIKNNKIINKINIINNKKNIYINCNIWGRKFIKYQHFLDYNTSKLLFNNGWDDTKKYLESIL